MDIRDFRENLTLLEKASHIRALITDVDGVLTNGQIIYSDKGEEVKAFNVKDGFIVAHLRKSGIVTGIITGRESEVVERRSRELGFDFCYQGAASKVEVLKKVCARFDLSPGEIAYIGDDINDLGMLKACGISCAPADAPDYILRKVDVVARNRGGEGVYREVADMLLDSRGFLDEVIEDYESTN